MSEVICIKKLAEKYKVEGFCRCPRCNAEALPLFKKTQGAGGREQGEKEEKDDVLDRVRSGDVCGGVRGNIYPGLTDIGEGAKNAISGEKTE